MDINSLITSQPLFSSNKTETSNKQVITIDRTQPTNAPADLKAGQIPVAHTISEAKVTEFIKQFLPRHEASPIFLNQLIKDLPKLMENESVLQVLKDIAARIIGNLPPKEQLITSQGLKQAIVNSGLFLEAGLLSALAGEGVQVDDFKENLLKFIHALKQETSHPGEQLTQVDLDLLKNLQSKTENTVAKIVLDQLMSLPKDDSPKQLWVIDIPFLDRQQAEAVKIEIQQDKESKQPFDNKDWSVNITITPPVVGTIHCIVSYRNNVINTYFKSQSTQTTELIKSHLDYLKNQLEESGLTIGLMDAQVGAQKTQAPRQLAGQKLFDEQA